MKKILAFVLALAMLLTLPLLYACGDGTTNEQPNDQTQDPAGDNKQPDENPDENETPDENEEIKKQIARGYMENVKVYTYETFPVDKINKIAVCVSEDKIFDMRRQIEEKYSDICDLNMSWKTVLEIQAKNVSKGNLLNTIRDEYKQNGKNIVIYAVGDYENDLDMMSKADFACCPSNSLDRVKEFCSIHLCSNNDGAIADLIEKLEKEYNA